MLRPALFLLAVTLGAGLASAQPDAASADTLLARAEALARGGDHEAAVSRSREAVRMREAALGPDDPAVAEALVRLGRVQMMGGDDAAAREPLGRAVSIVEAALGPDDPSLAEPLELLGWGAAAADDPATAVGHFERVLALRERALGRDHPETVYVLYDLARAYRLLDRVAEADAALGRAGEAVRTASGPPAEVGRQAAVHAAELQWAGAERDEVRAAYALALASLDEGLGPEHPETAGLLDAYARFEAWRAEARPLLERIVAAAEPGSAREAWATEALARALVASGDPAAAIPQFEQAVERAAAAHGAAAPETAEALGALGDARHRTGDLAGARRALERAVEIDVAQDDAHLERVADRLHRLREVSSGMPARPEIETLLLRGALVRRSVLGEEASPASHALTFLALHYLERGDPGRASRWSARAVGLVERSLGEHPALGWAHSNHGTALLYRGDLAEARLALDRALAQFERTLGADAPETAAVLSNLGGLLANQGDFETARALLERAQAVALRSVSAVGDLFVLNSLAVVRERLGDLDAARELLERALGEAEQGTGAEYRHAEAMSAMNLAGLLQAAGDYAATGPLLDRAFQVQVELRGETHPSVANVLQAAGVSVEALGAPGEARTMYEAARAIREQAFGPWHPSVAETLTALATLALDTGAAADAAAYAAAAARASDRHTERVLPALAGAEQRAFIDHVLGRQTELLLSIGSVGPDLVADYDLFGGWKGLLLHRLRRQTAVAALADDPAHGAGATRLEALRADIALAYRLGDEALDALSAEKEALERTLAAAIPDLADPWREGGSRALAAALGPGGVFVDLYRVGDEADGPRYAAVVTAHAGFPEVLDLGPAAPLDAALAAWRGAATDGLPAAEVMAALAEALWGPLVGALPAGTDRVWVAPDGPMSRAPWATLAAEASAAQTLAVAQVPSGRALLRLLTEPAAAEAGGPVLLVGEVDFGRGAGAFAALPGTATEVREVAALAADRGLATTMLRGAAPTAPAVRDALADAAYAHLATHGFFYAEPASPAGRLRSGWRTDEESPVPGRALAADGDWGRSPLALSGLALADANSPDSAPGRGTLTAEELVGLDLRGTRLVALSACDTGRGAEVTGQGVLGLQASLTAAGARAVLMSLWRVPDASTAALMERFYRALWTGGLAPAAALRRAQAEIRSTPGWEAPVHWAGWVLSGDAL